MNCPNCGTTNTGTSSTCAACGYEGLPVAAQVAVSLSSTANGQSPHPPLAPSAVPLRASQPSSSSTGDDGTTILVLALAALFVPILAPVAWVKGHNRQQRVDRGEVAPNSNAQTGKVVGMVLTIMYGLLILMFFSSL